MAKPNDIGGEQEGTFLVRISASDANTYVMSHYIAPALTERFDFSALTPWVSCVFISIGEMELVCLSLPLVVWVSFALLAYLFEVSLRVLFHCCLQYRFYGEERTAETYPSCCHQSISLLLTLSLLGTKCMYAIINVMWCGGLV